MSGLELTTTTTPPIPADDVPVQSTYELFGLGLLLFPFYRGARKSREYCPVSFCTYMVIIIDCATPELFCLSCTFPFLSVAGRVRSRRQDIPGDLRSPHAPHRIVPAEAQAHGSVVGRRSQPQGIYVHERKKAWHEHRRKNRPEMKDLRVNGIDAVITFLPNQSPELPRRKWS